MCVCMSACQCGGGRVGGGVGTTCTRVLLCVWVSGLLRRKPPPGSLVQQLVSFIHAFFVPEHFFHERRVQALPGGWGQLGAGYTTASAMEELPVPPGEPTRQKPSPSGKWMWRKRHRICPGAVSGSSNRAGQPNYATRPRNAECLGVEGGLVASPGGRRSQGAPRLGAWAAEPMGSRRFRGLRRALLGLGGGQGRPAGRRGGRRAQRPPYGRCAASSALERAWGGHCAPGARAPGSRCGARCPGPHLSRRCGGLARGRGGGLWHSALHCGGGNRFPGYLPASPGAAGAAGAGQ